MLPTAIKRQCEQDIFRDYIANGIQMISENTARKEGDRYLSLSYREVINPKPVYNRTGDEIVEDIIQRAGLKIIG